VARANLRRRPALQMRGTRPMNPMFSTSDFIAAALDDVAVNVRCGLHPWERHAEHPNRLAISLRLFAPLAQGRAAQAPIIDYDRLRNFIKGLESREHVDLIETLADEIAGACFADGRVEACFISIRKPDIFPETHGAGVDVYRTRAGWFRDG
jgi:dihydroneopterin aldolase